jgi:glycosyltransferase A (GT-A) superfamily protein (DUF2064 family)
MAHIVMITRTYTERKAKKKVLPALGHRQADNTKHILKVIHLALPDHFPVVR